MRRLPATLSPRPASRGSAEADGLARRAGGYAAKFRLNILSFFKNSFPDRHKNLWVGLIIIFILDRINRIDWIYCFLGFQTKPRNSHPAFSGKRKPKRPMVLLLNVHVASLFCFYSQMNSLEEGYRFLPFFWKGKKKS